MHLDIDTTGSDRVVIVLTFTDGRRAEYAKEGAARADSVLFLVSDAVSGAGGSLADCTGITVHTGPGSFTGTRVGIAIARALGLVLDVPVNGQPATAEITPRYAESKFDKGPA